MLWHTKYASSPGGNGDGSDGEAVSTFPCNNVVVSVGLRESSLVVFIILLNEMMAGRDVVRRDLLASTVSLESDEGSATKKGQQRKIVWGFMVLNGLTGWCTRCRTGRRKNSD